MQQSTVGQRHVPREQTDGEGHFTVAHGSGGGVGGLGVGFKWVGKLVLGVEVAAE